MTGTEVVNWEEKLRQEAKEVAKSERASVTRISLKSGIMSIQEVPLKDNTLECIVLAFIKENLYYKDPYQAGVIKPPTCYAYGTGEDHMVPHETIPEPQNPTCAGCWAAQPKSAGNGRKGPACGLDRRKLIVIPMYKEVADVAKAEMAVMSLPYFSVKNWKTYTNVLSATPTIQRPPYAVATRIKVVPDMKAQFKVTFEFIGNLPEELLSVVSSKIEPAMNILMTPYNLTEPEQDPQLNPNLKTKY